MKPQTSNYIVHFLIVIVLERALKFEPEVNVYDIYKPYRSQDYRPWMCWEEIIYTINQPCTRFHKRFNTCKIFHQIYCWLITFLHYVPLKNFSLTCIWRRHRCWWRAVRFRPMLRAFEHERVFIVPSLLWHRASVFSGLIRRTIPLSCLLLHEKGCWRPILTRILTGIHSDASYDT
jgi:hypothetical protein